MMKRLTVLLVTVFSFCLAAQPVVAQYTIWHSPLSLSSDEPQLTISHPASILAVMSRVETSSVGDLQWVHLGLTIPSNVVIDSVIVCYELSSSSSFISQVRLTTMKTPDAAAVLFDDGTDLTDVGPACYTTSTGSKTVGGTITLSLQLNFASTADWIDIGAVGIVVSPNVTSVTERNGTSASSGFELEQNYPNPFNPRTTIDYKVQKAANVRIDIFDTIGRRVRTLVDSFEPAGTFSVQWDGKDNHGVQLATGTYYYRMKTGNRTSVRKMLFLK